MAKLISKSPALLIDKGQLHYFPLFNVSKLEILELQHCCYQLPSIRCSPGR